MTTERINISIPRELNEFLKNNPDLSPSKMFQAKCYDIMKQRKDFEHLLKVKDIVIQRLNGFIIHKNLWGEFNEWKSQK